MRKSLLARAAILILTISTLSGCIWAVEDDGYGRRGGHGGGGHEGKGHGGGDRGDRH